MPQESLIPPSAVTYSGHETNCHVTPSSPHIASLTCLVGIRIYEESLLPGIEPVGDGYRAQAVPIDAENLHKSASESHEKSADEREHDENHYHGSHDDVRDRGASQMPLNEELGVRSRPVSAFATP